jgi:putative transposase
MSDEVRDIRTFKYRICPNKAQEEKLQWTLNRCREVYNAALQERSDTWNNIKRHPNYYDAEWLQQAKKEHSISLYDQQNQLSPMKKDRTDFQDLSAAHILNDVCARVDKAFKAYFKRCKSGKTPGYPHWANYHRYDSFTYPDVSGWKLIPGEKNRGKLLLTKIGDIEVKLNRPIEGKIKTCTIKREGEHWYACFACEVEAHKKLPYTDLPIGIDLGLAKFATLSNGATIENPRYFRGAEKKLAKAQKALSMKKKKGERDNAEQTKSKKTS